MTQKRYRRDHQGITSDIFEQVAESGYVFWGLEYNRSLIIIINVSQRLTPMSFTRVE